MNPPTSKPQFLTIEEKRAWLARIFRDTSGEYSDADKFKAMIADTCLAMLTPNRQEKLDSSSSQPEVYHWENPKICATCALLEPFHEHDGVMYHTCPHAPAEDACITDPHQRACKHYTPKPVKDTI